VRRAPAAPTSWPEHLTRFGRSTSARGGDAHRRWGDDYAFTRREGTRDHGAGGGNRKTLANRLPGADTPAPPAAAHGAGPKATPLFHNGKLYSLTSAESSSCDAASGAIWQTGCPVGVSVHGAASHPPATAGQVTSGNYDPLTAFDADTGEVKWRSNGGGFYASPVPIELAGTRQVVTVLKTAPSALSIADARCCGNIRGRRAVDPQRRSSTATCLSSWSEHGDSHSPDEAWRRTGCRSRCGKRRKSRFTK
jgi:hypothetical protein